MAIGRIPGPIRHEPFSKLVPARTPGSLGRNDAADPNAPSLLGDTPGPQAMKDHEEPFANSALTSIPYT
jgi:hypothetical protein